jgi:flagella basal body P-ring formation protein FlgA
MDAYGKAGRTVFVLMLLAWAAGILWAGVARGDEILADPQPSQEKFATGGTQQAGKFTPGSQRFLAGATLEMRSEATIVGGDVKLKQICRWSDNDKAAFEPIADLVVARVGDNSAFRAVTVKELKSTLSDAGVNMAVIRFAGAMHCTITRSDAQSDEKASLQEWVNARLAQGAATQPAVQSTPVAIVGGAQTAASVQPAAKVEHRTLRDLLVADIAERLSLDPSSIQLFFSPSDENFLRLSEPLFHFSIDGDRIHNLGDVTWEVGVVSADGKAARQKAYIRAKAKAWQELLLARVPLAFHQEIRSTDLVEQRTLLDQLQSDTPLKRDQVVGQMAGRELRAGTVITSKLVDAMPLAKVGDLITVTLSQGGVQITTVARATETGSYGQTIRAKHEGDNAMYDVTMTGPKAGRMTPMTPSPERALAKVQ